MARLAVVIPCTRPTAASGCLSALAQQAGADDVEVAVVGDVDGVVVPDGLATQLIACATRHPNVRRNVGIAATAAPLVALVDDDTEPLDGWVSRAMGVDPDGSDAVVGREVPLRDTPTATLLHAVCSSVFTEGTRAHVHGSAAAVAWTDASFCNLVVPRALFASAGIPSTEVAADVDDLEWSLRVRDRVRFVADPHLVVRHDRYPDSVAAFLRYRWRLRTRGGQKLVTYPGIYWRIPQMGVLVAAPWLGLAVAGALGPRRAWRLGWSAWGALALAQVPAARRFGGWRAWPAFVGIATALQVISVVGVQAGLVAALLGRRDRPPGWWFRDLPPPRADRAAEGIS